MFSNIWRGILLLKRSHVELNCFGRVLLSEKSKMASSFYSSWQSVYILSPDQPVYFKRVQNDELDVQNESESKPDLWLGSDSKILETFLDHAFIFPKCETYTEDDLYVQSAIQSMKLYKQSTVWTDFLIVHCLQFGPGIFRRGLYLNGEGQRFTSFVKQFVKENTAFEGFQFLKCDSRRFKLKPVCDGEVANEDMVCIEIMPERFVTESGSRSSTLVSPIFQNVRFTPLFHDYQRTRSVLDKISDVEQVKELLEIVDRSLTCLPEELWKRGPSHPFVVVEGMDATGKTTLTKHLQDRLAAERYYSPPPVIEHLRKFFDGYPELVRRAYYSMGNYIVAEDIYRECQTRPVIMDRYWHSTAAYGIANETSSGDLPPKGHAVYNFPSDVLKPSLVLFLTVSEDVRKQRLTGRGLEATFEEKVLDRDHLFRQRLCEAYRRMQNPSLVEIDAGGSVEEVQMLAVEAVQKFNTKFNSA